MKIGMIGFLLGFLLLAVPDFAQAGEIPQQTEETDFVLTMERLPGGFGGGGGWFYSVTLTAEGKVSIERLGREKGRDKHQFQIPKERVQKLISEIRAIDFFSLKDRYAVDASGLTLTCLTTTRITVTLDGKTKSVEDYLGTPESVEKLEVLIDEVTQVKSLVEER